MEDGKPYGGGMLVGHVSENKQEAMKTRCRQRWPRLDFCQAVCFECESVKLPVKEWLGGVEAKGHESLGWEE